MATVVAVVALVTATPAYAENPPPVIDLLDCTSYEEAIDCNVAYRFGENPVEITWYKDSLSLAAVEFRNKIVIKFPCSVGQIFHPKVVVKDALGRSVFKSTDVVCRTGGPPIITAMNCESGGRLIMCQLEYSGGRPHVTIRWYYNETLHASANDSTMFRHGCVPQKPNNIRVILVDSLNRVAEAWGGCGCNIGWP